MITTNIKPITYHNYSGNVTTQSQRHISSGIMSSDGETDPIFRASPAATITYEDIELWNSGGSIDLSSYITKDELSEQSYISSGALNEMSYVTHEFLSSQSYLTTELEPAFNASPAATISQEQIDSWDSGSSVDLSSYVQKSELSAQSYITSDALNGMSYVSHDFLSSQAYLTSEVEPAFHASPAATITYTDISNWSAAAGTLDMSAYTTKAELVAQSYVTATTLDSCGYLTSDVLSVQGYITGDVLSSQSYINAQVLSEQSYLTVELEPAFNASPAAGITSEDITRWDSGGGDLSLYVQKSELSEQAYITPAQLYSMSYITQSDIVFPDYSVTYQVIGDYVTKSQLSDQSYVQFATYTEKYKYIIYDGFITTIARMNQNTYTSNPLTSATTIQAQDSHNVCKAGIQSSISYNGTTYTADTNFSANIAPGFNGESRAKFSADYVELIPGKSLIIRDQYNTYKCNISFNGVTGTLQLNPANGISLQYKGARSFIASYDYVLEQMNDFVVSQAYIKSESDPIFSASPAAGITAQDIENWNAGGAVDLSSYVTYEYLSAQAYLTSVTFPDYSNTYQAKGNYLTSETDPVFSASPAAGITTQDIQNWNAGGSVDLNAYVKKQSQENTTISVSTSFPSGEFNSRTCEIMVCPGDADYRNSARIFTAVNRQPSGNYVVTSQMSASNPSVTSSIEVHPNVIWVHSAGTMTLWGDSFKMKYGNSTSFIASYQYVLDQIGTYVVSQSYVTATQLVSQSYITPAQLVSQSYVTTNDLVSQSYATKSYVANYVEDAIHEPVVVWETNGVGLTALETNMSASPAWQLTNLDMTPYKHIKIYSRSNQKSGATASASTTAAMVLEMSLDPRAAGPYGGHYVGSTISQKPNDANRLATLTCAVSADKTSFAVLRMTSLYGTASTGNSDVNAYVFKIVGYYDEIGGIDTTGDLSDYVSKVELSQQSYITSTTLSNQSYITSTALSNQAYVTSTSLQNMSYVTTTDLSNCAYVQIRLVTQAQYVDRQDNILYIITDAPPIS